MAQVGCTCLSVDSPLLCGARVRRVHRGRGGAGHAARRAGRAAAGAHLRPRALLLTASSPESGFCLLLHLCARGHEGSWQPGSAS